MTRRNKMFFVLNSLFFLTSSYALANESKSAPRSKLWAEALNSSQKPVTSAVGVSAGGCRIGGKTRYLSATEMCVDIRKKIGQRGLQIDLQNLKNNIGQESVVCKLTVNSSGSIGSLSVQKTSGSKNVDEQAIELIKKAGVFEQNPGQTFLVEFPDLTVKPVIETKEN